MVDTLESYLHTPDLVPPCPRPPIDVVSLVVTSDRSESPARAIMLTDLLATGRAALWVEHGGTEGRLLVEPVRKRAGVQTAARRVDGPPAR